MSLSILNTLSIFSVYTEDKDNISQDEEGTPLTVRRFLFGWPSSDNHRGSNSSDSVIREETKSQTLAYTATEKSKEYTSGEENEVVFTYVSSL